MIPNTGCVAEVAQLTSEIRQPMFSMRLHAPYRQSKEYADQLN